MGVRLNAYGKINLFLDVTARRRDGYHDIRSVMQTVSLCDRVTVDCRDGVGISLTANHDGVPTDERNLAYRAAKRFLETAGIERAVKIHLEKRIPVSAGLAGGSTDAAAVLIAMNRLLSDRFTVEELCAIGKTLGADIPFCIVGGTCEVTGIGDGLSTLPPMPDVPMVVCKIGEGISTPWAYRSLDERYNSFTGTYSGGTAPEGSYDALLSALLDHNAEDAGANLYNIFECVVLPVHQEAGALREELTRMGAFAALMSGSGPSVFGCFSSEAEAIRAAEMLNRRWGSEVAFPVFPVRREEIASSIEIVS